MFFCTMYETEDLWVLDCWSDKTSKHRLEIQSITFAVGKCNIFHHFWTRLDSTLMCESLTLDISSTLEIQL